MTTKTYARIAAGGVMELLATDGDITTMFDPSLVWVDCTSTNGCAVGWSYSSGVFAAPPLPTASVLWAQYQIQAQAALSESDKTILRCYENAVPTPAAWAAYRKALRAIVSATSGDSTQPLPARPAYPAGT